MAAFILPIAVPSTVCAALPTEVNGQALPSLATMLEKITPAVVNIATEGRQPINDSLLNDPFFKRFFGDTPPGERQINGTGSGVIIHAQRGHILTNSHVVESADAIHVTLKDGRKYLAEVVGIDPRADLAVLQIPAERLTAMRFGDSDRLRVGDFVVAIGNPYSIGQTVTSGIISALHRNPGISEYENFIQTDAPINLGNSGGPLVNLSGELIGINTAILGDQGGGNLGIGFAVPINTAAGVITQIVQYGSVERGQLGVEVQDVDSIMARDFGIKPNEGAIINQVLAGSPAEKAGVEAGDIIIKMNNKNVQGAVDVKNIIGDLRVGTEVNMTLLRAGRPRNITVIIAQPKTEKSAAPLRADNLQKATGQPFWEKGLR
ncbi:Do family serine endopeptidase [Thiothrix subterranea]|uniref:Do family serine endopeptidase n=2 Tax=Thiothrix subterranea TaxID=2735563 RepID=A0AA51MRY3_9GAMM|nr:Do family serine endopeptidase [Thiothrix subterranea]MDQ5769763.1 Do family serine endopeptidase [Thiothrix subterranea]WML87211.1 Do family serine endopeptidase [Thiothrix subterranea]